MKSPITKLKRGRLVTIYPEVRLWRKRMKRYKLLRKLLMERLLEKGWDKPKIKTWLSTPVRDLEDRCPKQLLNPRSIGRLYEYARKCA